MLCESIDIFAGSSPARPGANAAFAIWISSTGAISTGVTVTLTTSPATAKPHFAVCPSGHTAMCTLSTLGTGPVELQATVAVPAAATNGEKIKLTAKVASSAPVAAVRTSASITVAVATPTPAATGVPTFNVSTLPPLPAFAFTASPGSNVGPLFPSIPVATPSPTAQGPLGAGAQTPVAAVDPLGRQLLGTQLLGLAALFAAIGIVIARFTLRTPRLALAGARGAAKGGTKDSASGGAPADDPPPVSTAVADGSTAVPAKPRDHPDDPGQPSGLPVPQDEPPDGAVPPGS